MSKLWMVPWSRLLALLAAVWLMLIDPGATLGQPANTGQPTDALPQLQQRSPSASTPDFVLASLLAPPVGFKGTFIVSVTKTEQVTDLSGVYLQSDFGAARQVFTYAARVRYTILPADPDTGALRVAAEALPIDPSTGAALAEEPWSVTYVLADGRAQLYDDESLPYEYEDVIAPGWLARGTLTPPEQLPPHPIPPGFTWEATATLDFMDGVEEWAGAPWPVTGAFVDGVEVPGTSGPAVRLVETMTGTQTSRLEMMEGVYAQVRDQLSVEFQAVLLPGDLPVEMRRQYEIRQRWVVEDSPQPEMEGTVTFIRGMEQRVVRLGADHRPVVGP